MSMHTLVTGKTGTGKSTHLGTLVQADLRAGRGLALVDPHGDLADSVLLGVPSHRKNDLTPIDATKADTCPGLNPFRAVSPDRRALVASTLLATMRKLWPDFWGPRLEHVARHVFLALMEVRGATLLDAQRMLVDETHRHWVLRHVTDDLVRQFWSLEFGGYDKRFAAEVTAPILNKLGALLASPVVRSIVTTRRRQLDVRAIMDRGRVLVAKLDKGQIGEDAALLLGGLVLGALQHATMSRADVAPGERRPFIVYVDEIGSFATRPFLEMMAEARKYGVSLVLATQSLAALDEEVRAALLGNAGCLISFRVGADDAAILQKELIGRFGPPTLMTLDVGEHVARRGASQAVLIRGNDHAA